MDKECLFISGQPQAVSTYGTVGLPNQAFPTEMNQRITKEMKAKCVIGETKRRIKIPSIYNRNFSNWKPTNIQTD